MQSCVNAVNDFFKSSLFITVQMQKYINRVFSGSRFKQQWYDCFDWNIDVQIAVCTQSKNNRPKGYIREISIALCVWGHDFKI